jgi:glycosyltransferase involved in cell wall biosynthesis/predicted metal-dependent phosphoesterase TrpH
VDLHLHSRASTDTGSWVLRQAVLPESFTEPLAAYRVAKERGMDFVTLTDHNTLAGALEIAHLPDVFVSVEVTTRFAHDDTPLHVLVWGLDERQWDDIDHLRPNVSELVDYLQAADLAHALAHPLQRLGADLTADHIERCLLLFPVWEGINGSRTRSGNDIAQQIAQAALPDYLAKLADKHGITPRGDGPPSLTGGSDDHALLDAASAWTETPRAGSVPELLRHIAHGRTRPAGSDGGTTALAHAMLSLAIKSHAENGADLIPPGARGLIGRLIGHDITGGPTPTSSTASAAPDFGIDFAARAVSDIRFLRSYRRLDRRSESADRSQGLLRLATEWGHAQLANAAIDGTPSPASGGGLNQRLTRLLGVGALASPYFAAATYHASEARFATALGREFFGTPVQHTERIRVGMFTDTFDEVNGVAGTMRRLAEYAEHTRRSSMTIVTTGEGKASDHFVRLHPVGSLPLPAYLDRSWRLGVPSAIEILRLVEEREFDVIHVATPGPVGLCALLVARTLGLPFVVSHHTELARYALELTGDRLAAEVTALGLRWLYGQARRVYVPSHHVGVALTDEGVDRARLVQFSRGIDVERFDPGHRSTGMRRRLGGSSSTVVLYVGRLSKEKGIFSLAQAMRTACGAHPGLRLAIVGDGPDRAALADALVGVPHTFLGTLTGRDLASAYASSDIFCLPSETETFGQVALEAAASGLPVVVSDRGAAAEQIDDEETGLIAAGTAGIARAIERLAGDPILRRKLGAAARLSARRRPSWETVFAQLEDSYVDVLDQPSGGPGVMRFATRQASV